MVRVQQEEPKNVFVELLVAHENKEIEEKFKLKNVSFFFFLVCPAWATTCGWKSHTVPDSGELLANDKGVNGKIICRKMENITKFIETKLRLKVNGKQYI